MIERCRTMQVTVTISTEVQDFVGGTVAGKWRIAASAAS